jgi:hypothetical protein
MSFLYSFSTFYSTHPVYPAYPNCLTSTTNPTCPAHPTYSTYPTFPQYQPLIIALLGKLVHTCDPYPANSTACCSANCVSQVSSTICDAEDGDAHSDALRYHIHTYRYSRRHIHTQKCTLTHMHIHIQRMAALTNYMNPPRQKKNNKDKGKTDSNINNNITMGRSQGLLLLWYVH